MVIWLDARVKKKVLHCPYKQIKSLFQLKVQTFQQKCIMHSIKLIHKSWYTDE